MDPENFSVNDLLMERDFRKWARKPNPEWDSFWKIWRGTDAKRAELMDQARLCLLSIDFKKTGPQDIDDQKIFNRIKQTIQHDQVQTGIGFPENEVYN